MDSKLNKSSLNCSVEITDLYGNDTSVNMSPDMLIEKIKEIAIKQLKSDTESSTNFSQYRLVLVDDSPRALCDDKTAKQEVLGNGNCAILLKNHGHKQPVSSLVKDGIVSHVAPSSSAISRATEGLPTFGGSLETAKGLNSDVSSTTHVEQTFRKVLLSLLELSYKFMHFDQVEQESKAKAFSANEEDLKFLVEMGFTEKRAKKALRISNMNRDMAMEWLLNHSEMEQDCEDELSTQNDEVMDTTTVNSTSTGGGMRTRSRTFVPNPTHLSSLIDMGFSKEESTQALRINGNNPNTACEWLLSDHKTDVDTEEEGDEPLDPNSELYKALITNPTIHIGLHDKKVLEALEDMVENPWRRNNWAYESAVGNVLLQILKLYNKYSTTAPQT